MAYDDDGSRFSFKDLEDLFQSLVSDPGGLTFSRLQAALVTLSALATAKGAYNVSLAEAEAALREHRLSSLSIGTVAGLLEGVQQMGAGKNVGDLTVRDLERLIARTQNR